MPARSHGGATISRRPPGNEARNEGQAENGQCRRLERDQWVLRPLPQGDQDAQRKDSQGKADGLAGAADQRLRTRLGSGWPVERVFSDPAAATPPGWCAA